MARDNVIKRMTENLQNDAYGESWAKPLLALIEYEQTDESKNSFFSLDKNIHADHILPLRWDLVAEWNSQWKKEDADQCINRLGNLTLLSGKKNMAQHNDPPNKKRDMYKIGQGGTTAFEISKMVLEKLKTGKWTKDDIEERQEWIINETLKLLGLKFISSDKMPYYSE
jgi:hypothetical protein